MMLPSHDYLNTACLQRLFDNMTECYKLFWFQAICETAFEGKQRISFDYLVNKMIVNAWYMVSEYKLNLGPADTLEALVHYTFSLSGLKSNEKKEDLFHKLGDTYTYTTENYDALKVRAGNEKLAEAVRNTDKKTAMRYGFIFFGVGISSKLPSSVSR